MNSDTKMTSRLIAAARVLAGISRENFRLLQECPQM
jgi:hypothetical protein